jgi:hypothetical protein
LVAFACIWLDAHVLGKALIDFVGNRLNLARVAAAADQEVIGKGARLSRKLEQGNVFGLLVVDRFKGKRDLHSNILRRHRSSSLLLLCWASPLDASLLMLSLLAGTPNRLLGLAAFNLNGS